MSEMSCSPPSLCPFTFSSTMGLYTSNSHPWHVSTPVYCLFAPFTVHTLTFTVPWCSIWPYLFMLILCSAVCVTSGALTHSLLKLPFWPLHLYTLQSCCFPSYPWSQCSSCWSHCSISSSWSCCFSSRSHCYMLSLCCSLEAGTLLHGAS